MNDRWESREILRQKCVGNLSTTNQVKRSLTFQELRFRPLELSINLLKPRQFDSINSASKR
jgi:hypothetical protein